MIVKCIHNKKKDLPEDCESNSSDPEWNFSIILNKHYIVYAMTIRSNYVWYYICDEHYSYFPTWKPSPLFAVVDGAISKYWIYSFIWKHEVNYSDTTWAYPEWANDPNGYYDRLSDGEEKEVKIFQAYKQAMDLEFPNPSVLDYAKALDAGWLMCDYCIDAWKSETKDQGLVVCPTCNRMLHNPRY